MNILVENGISYDITKKVIQGLQTLNLNADAYGLEVHSNEIELWNLNSKISQVLPGKKIILTTRTIQGKPFFGSSFEYHGSANAIGGSCAVVTVNEKTLNKIDKIAIHETLHLKGLVHCGTPGCIMAFKLCKSELQYCLNCAQPCEVIRVCDKCRGDLDGRK